jgi:hypothetical protein
VKKLINRKETTIKSQHAKKRAVVIQKSAENAGLTELNE